MLQMRTRKWLAVVAIASAVAAESVALIGLQGDVRTIIVIWFVLACPGLSIVLTMNLADRVLAIALSIGISLALAVCIATVMVLVGAWMPMVELSALAIVTVAVAGWVLQRDETRPGI